MQVKRCGWCGEEKIYVDYHDHEWGIPVYSDQQLFEFLLLEGMQAGLSWITILKKRENFRQAFEKFNPEKMVRFTPKKIAALMNNSGIIRNRLKINAAISNAKSYLNIIEKGDTFSNYLWRFCDFEITNNLWRTPLQVPASNNVSDAMAKHLKKDGFKFVGTTICYAFMQAVGMVNDHLTSCFRHGEVSNL